MKANGLLTVRRRVEILDLKHSRNHLIPPQIIPVRLFRLKQFRMRLSGSFVVRRFNFICL